MNLFWCFVTPMKLHFNTRHRCGMKMVQFHLNNSPSKYSSTSPYLVSPERAISILALTYVLGKTFLSKTIDLNEGFRPPSSGKAATRTWFASLIGRMSQTAHLADFVYVFAASVFSSNLVIHYFDSDFIQDNRVCNVLNETDRSELSQGKT